MKLKIEYDFTLEVGEDTYTGIFCDLSKKKEKELQNTFKSKEKIAKTLKKKSKELKRLQRAITIQEKLENWAAVEKLEVKLDKIETVIEEDTEALQDSTVVENMFKKRLEISLMGDDRDAILDVANTYGYERVLNTILEDVREQNSKN